MFDAIEFVLCNCNMNLVKKFILKIMLQIVLYNAKICYGDILGRKSARVNNCCEYEEVLRILYWR